VNLVHNAPPLADKTHQKNRKKKEKKEKKKGLCWPGQCPETARTDGQTDIHVTLIYKINISTLKVRSSYHCTNYA
jgi:hypothetical protein